MPLPRNIYLLDPKKLNPETIAVAFAKTSRSPLSFQQIADELSDEKSADFHEKWVVGYGHSSVAEHAVLHIAVENISRLAVECLESNRLASYTEKSSRYQIWDREHFYIPTELRNSHLRRDYIQLMELLFDHYQESVKVVEEYLQRTEPKNSGENDRAFQHRLRTQTADACRYYLPASALANVGISINARALEHAIQKMLSHPLAEVRQIGKEIKTVAQENVPTLIKYAYENPYLMEFPEQMKMPVQISQFSNAVTADWLHCVKCDKDGANRVLAAVWYRYGGMNFTEAYNSLRDSTELVKMKLTSQLLGRLSEHDIPLRELEYATVSYDLVIDQGAYFELKRHRMMTQTPQDLTIHLGFAVPKLLVQAGLGDQFVSDMSKVVSQYEKIAAVSSHAAGYLVPNAFNRRVFLQMNLRSALHLIRLRTAPNAHFAIRRPVLRIAEEIQKTFPLFAPYFKPDSGENWRSLTSDYFERTR